MAVLSLSLSACGNKKEKAKLPPASGPQAAPRKPLPSLGDRLPPGQQMFAHNIENTTGTTYPQAKAAVGPTIGGIIAKILVKEGDTVKAGQVLFRLRTADVGLRVNQANAGVYAAQVRLQAVKVEYDRTKRLFDKQAVNHMAWDRVQAQYKGAAAGLKQARAALLMVQKGWADSVVKSPIAGIVTKKLKNVGEMATTMPPSVVVVVEDHSTLELKFRLPERALKKLAVKDVFVAEFTAIDITKNATVIRIAPSIDPRSRTVEVVASIDNTSGKLKTGMLAKVRRKDAK